MKLDIILETYNNPGYILTKKLREEFPELEILWIVEHDSAIRLSDIEVKPEYRNKGIGSKVIQRIKEYAKSVGKPIILSAYPQPGKKTALNRFYARSDFKKPGRSKNYSLPMHTHIWNV